MNADTSRRISAVSDWLALACLAAMVSLPFLHPRHYNPIPSFWSEWWAFAFGLAAAALLLIRPGVWRPFGLPGVAAIPLVFMSMAMVQYFAGRWYFVEPWLFHAAYLLWAMLLVLAARSFVVRRGLTPFADVLATAVLFGAFANTIASALQFHNTGFQSGWVFVRLNAVPYSNLGQANHFNHQLWLGIASLYYLHLRQRCRLSIALPALLLLLFAATMSTSKSILLYPAAITIITGLMRWRHPSQAQLRQLWQLTLPLLPMVLLLQWLVSAWGIAGDADMPTATQRLFNEVSGFQIRWRLARTAWDVFLASPLLGSGVGTLSWQFFLDNSRYPLGAGPAVAEHAHNLPLQLLAEYGIVPVVILFWLLWRWLCAFWQQGWQPANWWLLALLSVASIHSLLEYPLWYSFFLGPVALLLGAGARPAIMLNNGWRGAVMCALIVCSGLVPLTKLRIEYTQLENSINFPVATSGTTAWQNQIDTLASLQKNSLLAPHVMLALASMMEPSTKDLDAKVEVCQQGMHFAPARRVVFKCGILMALAGDEKGALEQTERSLRAYPKEASRVEADIKALLPTYPQLQPLLTLAERYVLQAKQLP